MVEVCGALADGSRVSVSGTLMGIRRVEKIIKIDNYDLDLATAENLLFLRYADRPGVVGAVGNALGALKINIAGMQVARDERGGEALMVLTVDSAIPADLLAKVAKETDAKARFVTLV
jgi:D-3-phosphoglycerate dehydrogenase